MLNHSDVYALGYPRVLPVIPRDKAPGMLNGDGKWHLLKGWATTRYAADDRKTWTAAGAGVGLLPGPNVLALDADTLDLTLAQIIREEVERFAPNCPVRIGQDPKALYLVRLSAPVKRSPLAFDGGALEFRTQAQHTVLEGVHQKTGQPYRWPRPLVRFEDLPELTPADVDTLVARLTERLPAAQASRLQGGGEEISQASLKGDPDRVEAAVAAMRNPASLGWDDFVQMACAIKGAIPDDLGRGFDIFCEWCDRWEGGVSDPVDQRKAWDSIRPPVRIGANWLYEKAAEWSGGTRITAHGYFDDLGDPEPSLFEAQHKAETAAAQADDVYPLLSIGDIENRPPLEWLVARHIPKVSLGFLYSIPGAGKSFLALDLALTIASGADAWFGDAIKSENRTVLYIAAEGAYGFGDRIAAWKKHRGASKNMDQNFFMLPQTINFMHADDVGKLLRTVRALGPGRRPCLVVVDTVSRMLPGADENLQKDMTLFVRACDAVEKEFECAVLAVHHAGKSGDLRGSTVLTGAGDFIFKLDRNAKKTRIGTLHSEKQKDGEDGWSDAYSFTPVMLAPDGSRSSLVVTRTATAITDALDDQGKPTDRAQDVLSAIAAAWNEGRPWSAWPQAKARYAVRHMAAMGFNRGDAESLLAALVGDGLIEDAVYDTKRHIEGYKVVAQGQVVREGSIFD